MSLIMAVIFGIGFGYILQRVGALEYENIINTLRLKDLTILKFMLLTVAITTVGVFSLRSMGIVTLDLIVTNPVSNVIGGLIFGAGFAFSGYCPGTSIGAMGEGKRDAKFTVLGGIAGVLSYTLVQQFTGLNLAKFDWGKISLADLISLDSFSTAVIYSIIIIAIVYFIDMWEQRELIKSSGRIANHVQE
jgi:uncharacterized protein